MILIVGKYLYTWYMSDIYQLLNNYVPTYTLYRRSDKLIGSR